MPDVLPAVHGSPTGGLVSAGDPLVSPSRFNTNKGRRASGGSSSRSFRRCGEDGLEGAGLGGGSVAGFRNIGSGAGGELAEAVGELQSVPARAATPTAAEVALAGRDAGGASTGKV